MEWTALKSLIIPGDDKKRVYYEGGKLPLEVINILPQPRQTFDRDELQGLANDIARNSLLNPLIVAAFDQKRCLEYLRLNRAIHPRTKTPKLRTLKAANNGSGEALWYILIAGERRFRSFLLLKENGCNQCQTAGEASQCFDKHFPDGQIEVRICHNLPPVRALTLQFSENTHIRPKPEEEALVFRNWWTLIRQHDPKFPLAKFARLLSRGEETIRDGLRYCSLPDDIQEKVTNGEVPYGTGIELARLQEVGIDKNGLLVWLTKALVRNWKVSEFRAIVTKYLADLKSPQTILFDYSEDMEPQIRRVVARHTVAILHQGIEYLFLVNRLFYSGDIGKELHQFSEGSPVRVYRRFADYMEETFPVIESFLPKRERTRIRRIIAETQAATQSLEAVYQKKKK